MVTRGGGRVCVAGGRDGESWFSQYRVSVYDAEKVMMKSSDSS